ncbi:glycosyltransferase family 2 protein [Jeotgalibaca porci]|uniref:glycosyltransferase family 2 protein n=1 Tax=Jeotgalibaca porci TaxID=1868793 RepID=UPI003F8F8C7F
MNFNISVIIPCYNLEDKIEKCLKSIQRQTHQNIEIIIVDDGSTDNSVAIIKTLANNDARIKLLIQENNGPSSARNKGIRYANGDYIMFVDGDDYISDDYISNIVDNLHEQCDMIIAGFRYVYDDGTENIIEGIDFDCSKEEYIKKFYIESIKRRLIFGPCNKLYKKSILDKNNICFNEDLEIREDGLFVMHYLEHVDNLSGITDSGYYYIQNEFNTSLISKFHQNEKDINEMYFNKLVDFIGEERLEYDAINTIYPMYLNMDISSIRKFYGSKDYNLVDGWSYIKAILAGETFRFARKRLFWVNKKVALKYFRPVSIVHMINYTAVKRSRRR